jgi:hypothetical protein
MHPKPKADTSGPFFPSGRSRISFSYIINMLLDDVSQVWILSSPGNCILRYNKMAFLAKRRVTTEEFEKRA